MEKGGYKKEIDDKAVKCYIQSMVGFHANDAERCKSFVNGSQLIIDSEDTQYLGTGMYFWTNLTQAKWWNEKKKKNTGVFVRAVLKEDTEKFLDLTDIENVERFERLFGMIDKGIIQKYKNKVIKLNRDWNSAVGAWLDAIFEGIPYISEEVDLMRCFVQYPEKKEADFFCFSNITVTNVEIYLARNESPILDRRYVNDK